MSTTKSASPPRSARPLVVSDKIAVAPQALYFPAPHNRNIANTIVITNLSTTHNCIFKLRTINPTRYSVKPRLSVIAPKSMARVHITLLALPADTDLASVSKDRFELIVKLIPPSLANQTHNAKDLWERCGEAVEADVAIPCIFNAAEVPKDVQLSYPSPAALSTPVSASNRDSTGSAAAGGLTIQVGPDAATGSAAADAAAPGTPAPSQVQQKREVAAAAAASAFVAAATNTQQVVDAVKAREKALRDDISRLQPAEEASSAALADAKKTSDRHEQRAQRLHTAAEQAASGARRPAGGVYLSVVIFWMIVAYAAGLVARQVGGVSPEEVVAFIPTPLRRLAGGDFSSFTGK